jgi:hypothetical protein
MSSRARTLGTIRKDINRRKWFKEHYCENCSELIFELTDGVCPGRIISKGKGTEYHFRCDKYRKKE